MASIESVKKNSKHDKRFVRKTAQDDSPYFVLTATNLQTIGKSEMYSSVSAMENGIASLQTDAPGAAIKEIS